MNRTFQSLTVASALVLTLSALAAAPSDKDTDTAANNPFGHYLTITTSPLLGQTSAYDASDLMYFTPSVNEALNLLEDRQQFSQHLKSKGLSFTRPIIEVSGGLEADIFHTEFFQAPSDNNIKLSTAELDIHALLNPWASGFMSIDYGDPASQSKDSLYLKRGFATIGNLEQSPVYVSIGKMYAPNGKFSTAMLTNPVTVTLDRILSTAALVGYHHDHVFGSVFTYQGDTTNARHSLFKQEGIALGYQQTTGPHPFEIGASLVSNLADSAGMQDTAVKQPNPTTPTLFAGFAKTRLRHDVPGLDAYGKISFGHIGLMAEYNGATRAFDSNDMTFNGSAAKPRAFHTEMTYATHIATKPVSFAMAYGHTWQALALNLPENSYTADASVSMWRDTLETLEYRHDTNYSSSTTAKGRDNSSTNAVSGPAGGGTNNSVTLELGVYF